MPVTPFAVCSASAPSKPISPTRRYPRAPLTSAWNATDYSLVGKNGTLTVTSDCSSRTGFIAHPRVVLGGEISRNLQKALGRQKWRRRTNSFAGVIRDIQSRPGRRVDHPWRHVLRQCGGLCTFIGRRKELGVRRARRMGGFMGF
jgi:hypothetical protein